MKYWKLTVLAMTAITASSPAQNAGNHNPAFSVPNTFIGGEPYIFIGEDDNQVFPHRTPVELKYRDAAPEGGRTGITTLTWSSGGDKVDSYNFKPEGGEDGSIGVIDGDGQGNGEKDGGDDRKWTWNGDAEQQNYDGKIIYLQGKTAASSGDPATLKAFHKEKPDDPEEDAFEREFTLLKVELDVNNDGDVTDAVDGLENYLPGYEGDDPKLNSGTTFETAAYSGAQAVRLVLGAEIDNLEFKIKDGVTNYDGYCVNGDGPSLSGNNDEDFSFDADSNLREMAATVANGETSAVLYCKDYGAACTIEVIVDGTTLLEVNVPEDSNGDQLADAWQMQQIQDWNAQYGDSLDTSSAQLSSTWTNNWGSDMSNSDVEKKDPDQSGSGLHEHKTAGDGLSAEKEYRGFITDLGPNHNGGHKRLSAAKKELLVEVSEMAGIQSAMNVGINPNISFNLHSIQTSVTDFYRDRIGIDCYWARDEVEDLGGVVDYDGDGQLNQPGERQNAYIWDSQSQNGEVVRESPNSNPNTQRISGGAYLTNDRKLNGQDPILYEAYFELSGVISEPGRQIPFNLERNDEAAGLHDFVKLVLITRWGQVLTTAPGVLTSDVYSLVKKTENNKATFDGYFYREGALCSVVGTAEEGDVKMSHNGNHYSQTEFDSLFEWVVAHEIGHLFNSRSSHSGAGGIMSSSSPNTAGLSSINYTSSSESFTYDFSDKSSVLE